MAAGKTQVTLWSVVLLHLLLPSTVTRGQVMQKLWTRVPDLDNLQLQVGELRRLQPQGRSGCSVACSKDPACVAFNVHDQARLCFLEYGSVSPLAKPVRTEGFRYYVPHEGECQESEGLVLLPGPLCLLLVPTRVSAPQADSGCHDRGLQLISLDTQLKVNIFIEYLRIKGKESEFSWFVGLHYSGATGTWVWENGQPMDPSLWGLNEPTGTNHGCILPFENISVGIHDAWPENLFPYVCERILTPSL